MIAELENLIALQKIDLEIRALESRLSHIPKEIANLEREIATEQANATSAENQIKESQKLRRALERELELHEGRIEKYKDQLMQVKSNEEYRAMQKQIQTAKEEASDKEDKILAKMEEAEQLQKEWEARQKELKEALVQVKKMEVELNAEASRLRTELENKRRQQTQILASLPEDSVALYRQISDARGGIAIAEARDEHCQVCHVRLRPQVYSDLRMANKILRCENCTRILYYLESPSSQS